MTKPEFKLLLKDMEPAIADALRRAFAGHREVFVAQGDALLSPADAIVTAANSFGEMGAGFDLIVNSYYGGEAQENLRAAIVNDWYGELPVGAAIVLPMNDKQFPYLVAAPTMRMPTVVRGTLAAYLAMRGALVAIKNHLKEHPGSIESVVCPGLATGIGGMDPDDAARQMQSAYEQVVLGGWSRIEKTGSPPFPRA